MQERLWGGAVALVLIALASGIADRRRRRRADWDRVGMVSWPLIQILALIGALACAILGLKV
jgi:multisubunit Na+/H+ antiporter MnhB subunit